MELQFGFVLAVVVGAIFLVDRLGGSDELARRTYQAALAVALAFTTFAATAAFVQGSYGDLANFISSDGEGEVINRTLIAAAVHYGAGVAALLIGLALVSRWTTLPTSLVIGGLILILFGGDTENSDLVRLYRNAEVDHEMEVTFFVVLLVGLMLLMAFGYDRWERVEADELEEPPDNV